MDPKILTEDEILEELLLCDLPEVNCDSEVSDSDVEEECNETSNFDTVFNNIIQKQIELEDNNISLNESISSNPKPSTSKSTVAKPRKRSATQASSGEPVQTKQPVPKKTKEVDIDRQWKKRDQETFNPDYCAEKGKSFISCSLRISNRVSQRKILKK